MMNFIKQKSLAIIFGRYTNYVLIFSIFSCLVSYVYFANATVRILTVLENSKGEAQSLAVEVSEFESKRLSIDHTVGSGLATRLGFVEVKDQTFILNKSKKSTVSFRTN
jgi:hypothetical protein